MNRPRGRSFVWRWWVCLGAAIYLLLAAPGPAQAQGKDGDQFVIGGSYALAGGEEIHGDLYVFGGSAELQAGSQVDGDVYLLGGSLRVEGRVDGDISALGGSLILGETAVVEGSLHFTGGSLDRASGAVVHGGVDRLSGERLPFNLLPVRPPRFWIEGNPIFEGLLFLLRAFLWAGAAILAALFFPDPVRRIAEAARRQPVLAALLGLLTAILAPLALLILVITLIGIPAAVMVALLLGLIWAYGLISLGTEVGRFIEQSLRQNWALPLSAGLGTFLLIVMINGFAALAPCIGWLLPALTGLLGTGAVLMTRFGTQPYPPVAL